MIYIKFKNPLDIEKLPGDFFVFANHDIKSKSELLEDLSFKLRLPNYFGFSWDALLDCLKDFHWLDNKRIVLVHKAKPDLKEEDLRIYLLILNEAVQEWSANGERYFEVFFPHFCETVFQLLLE